MAVTASGQQPDRKGGGGGGGAVVRMTTLIQVPPLPDFLPGLPMTGLDRETPRVWRPPMPSAEVSTPHWLGEAEGIRRVGVENMEGWG